MSTQTNQDVVETLTTFLGRYYEEDIGTLVQRYPREQRSLTIDYMDIFSFDPDIARDLREHPREFIDYFEEAVRLYDIPVDIDLADVTVRIAGMPDEHQFGVGQYRANQIGRYIGVSGQVGKLTQVKPKPVSLTFECQRCGTTQQIPQQGTDGIQEPHECSGCDRQGPFTVDYQKSEFIDHQLARMQRPPEETKGANDATVEVHFEGDAVGTLQAGDRVTVGGIMAIEEPSDGEITFDPYIDGRGVDIEETDYSQIEVDDHLEQIVALANGEHGDPYELLVQSVAPKIEGMDEIKESVVLQMFGGVRVEYPDGSHDRGDPHILLLGDPGTAKSSILEAVERKAPRSVYASGKGATAAGMTAAAVRDDFGPQEWSLEAGALVLADQGIACVDEIDKVDENAVDSMHEALSKQKVHVNKGGINTHLPTRTALLAAGNPKHGRFDIHEPIAEQIELGPTMLSRFDLLYMIDDSPDEERDSEIVDGMIESRATASQYTSDPSSVDDGDLSKIKPEVPTAIFRAWVAHAKQTVTPRIVDEDVKQKLKTSFTNLRMANGDAHDAPVPVTFRRLEGLQRLAEASARVRLSPTVEMEDIERAQRLIGRSMRDVGMDPESGQLDADIVGTGTSQTQDNRRRGLKDVIDEIADEHDENMAPLGRVLEVAAEEGWGKSQTKYDLKKLKEKGEAYEPQSDHYRTT